MALARLLLCFTAPPPSTSSSPEGGGSQVAITEYAAGAPKPTVAPVVLHANLQGAPLQDQSSGVTNLNYIAHPADVAADLGVFLQVVEMSHVTFLLASPTRAALPG